jgi:hypothetical protein
VTGAGVDAVVLDPLEVVAAPDADAVAVDALVLGVAQLPDRPGSVPDDTWLKITPNGPTNAATARTATVLRMRDVL